MSRWNIPEYIAAEISLFTALSRNIEEIHMAVLYVINMNWFWISRNRSLDISITVD